MKNTFKTLSLALISSAMLTACSGGSEVPADVEVTTDTLSEDVRADMALIRGSIPSPSDLTTGVSKAKFNYNKSLMNPSSKSGSYSSNFQKAAAMGVYGADLGYSAAYNQSGDLMEYFGAVTKLAKDLGLESAFDENLIGEIKDNMGKGDTLARLVDKAYDKVERHLRSNQRVATSAIIAAGGWIEGIYLSSSLAKDAPQTPENASVYETTWKHVYSFKAVTDLLNEYKSNADCAKMLEMLKDFQPYVDKTNKTGGGVLSQEDMTGIYTKISEIRAKLVS